MRKKSALIVILLSCLAVSIFGSTIIKNGEKLSIELEAVSLPMVMNMIAQQYGLNLVLAGNVKGDVTVRLENVEIGTALDAILFPNGYNYYIKDDVIIVKPIDFDAIGELESEIITLRYIDPVTVQKVLESIKSAKGSIVILDKITADNSGSTGSSFKANKIIISDFPAVISKMMDLIKKMDIAEQVISIEVKIIESQLDSQTKLGVTWPTAITSTFGNTTSSETDATTTSTSTDNVAGSWNPNNGNWTWGTLSVAQVSAVLNLLEKDGNSKLISNPHVTTLENHEAVIKIETVIPIPTVNRFTEGAATQDILTFYDEEIGISVVVTPRINENGRITMDIIPKIEDIIGYTGNADSQKPITISRSVQTTITVGDGETAALGGLLKEDVITNTQKVPLLGSIPLLGKLLFTSKSQEKSTTDLIILITPKIIY